MQEIPAEAREKAARHIKEKFRASMARVMVHHLDPYRRDDCIFGRITNTADFKHLARKVCCATIDSNNMYFETLNSGLAIILLFFFCS